MFITEAEALREEVSRLEAENAELRRLLEKAEFENARFRDYYAGKQIIMDWWKEGDVAHVVTTDGEQLYDYSKAVKEIVYEREGT